MHAQRALLYSQTISDLQRKIIIVIPGKIQGFCLCGNPLKGVIQEPPAAFFRVLYTLFYAKNLTIAQRNTMLAVSTGPFYFLSEKHSVLPEPRFPPLYTGFLKNATHFFRRIKHTGIIRLQGYRAPAVLIRAAMTFPRR